MGLLDRVSGRGQERGDDDDSDEKERVIDHWELRYNKPGQTAWDRAEHVTEHLNVDPGDLQEPLDEEAVKQTAETEGWPAGKYKCQARYEDGTHGPNKWTVEVKADESATQREEKSTEDRILETQTAILEELRDGSGSITSPDEARGITYMRALNGDLDEEQTETLQNFLESWEDSTREAPKSPNEVAGELYRMQIERGNVEQATELLDAWFAAENTGRQDLLELATSGDEFSLDMDTVKSLGMLRFLENPREFIREASAGVMEAGQGGVRDQSQDGGLSSLVGAATEPSEGEAPASEPEQLPEADEPADGLGTARELDIVGAEADEGGQADAAADAEGDSTSDPDPPAETDAAAAESDQGRETSAEADAEGVDEVLDDLDEQTDREAGEFPNAQDAMQDLEEAGETDTEAATDGGGD